MNIRSNAEAIQILNDTERSILEREQAIHFLVATPTRENLEHLVNVLEDDAFGVRWTAAAELANAGRLALEPLLRALIDRPSSVWLRESAYHVLHYMPGNLLRQQTAHLQQALKGAGANVAATEAAGALLHELLEAEAMHA
ncbi:MAG: hypothetical protein R2856_26080 [Caldilineaceae bacterium]|nr:hypothetical protein [Caldilineaceae bacterium]